MINTTKARYVFRLFHGGLDKPYEEVEEAFGYILELFKSGWCLLHPDEVQFVDHAQLKKHVARYLDRRECINLAKKNTPSLKSAKEYYRKGKLKRVWKRKDNAPVDAAKMEF
jgi:hypothetical protein